METPNEMSEIEILREKLAKNRAERDEEIANLEEKRRLQMAEYEERISREREENASRIRTFEIRRAKTVAVVKRSILCVCMIALFWILFWLNQCRISVLLMVILMALTHLAYYAGTWKQEVFQ